MYLEGDKVRSKDLGSLSPEAGAELLKARGAKGTDEELQEAAREYKGHGLALSLLGGYIRKRHKGDIRQRAHIPLLGGAPVISHPALQDIGVRQNDLLAVFAAQPRGLDADVLDLADEGIDHQAVTDHEWLIQRDR